MLVQHQEMVEELFHLKQSNPIISAISNYHFNDQGKIAV